MAPSNPTRALPPSRSCDACRTRKIRCSGPSTGVASSSTNPSCELCRRTGKECTYDIKYIRRGPTLAYVDALEKREAQLRALLENHLSPEEVATALGHSPFPTDSRLQPSRDPDGPPTYVQSPNSLSEPYEPERPGLHFLLPRIATAINCSPPDTSPNDLEPDMTWDTLLDGMDGLSLNGTSHPRIYGRNSGPMYYQDAANFKLQRLAELGQSPKPSFSATFSKPMWALPSFQSRIATATRSTCPSPGSAPFPHDSLARALFYFYFNHAAPFFLLLNREDFYDSYVDGLHLRDAHFGGIVALVCAIGAFFAEDSDEDLRLEMNKGGPSPTDAWLYFASRKHWAELYSGSITLFEIQYCALNVYYLRLLSRPHTAWIVAGVGIRRGMDIGCHRNLPRCQSPEATLRWRVAFGSLILMDRELSVVLGRTPCLHDEDSEYFSIGLRREVVTEQTFNVGEYLKRLISLSGVFSLTLRSIYSLPANSSTKEQLGLEWGATILKELNRAKDRWLDTLLDHQQWNPAMPDLVFLEQAADLHCRFHLLTILIHRPFISLLGPPPSKIKREQSPSDTSMSSPPPLTSSSSTFPSTGTDLISLSSTAAQVCLSAALACSTIVSVLDRRRDGSCRVIHHQMAMGVFASGVVILERIVELQKRMDVDPSEHSALAERDIMALRNAFGCCLRHLEMVGRKWASAQLFAEVLHGAMCPPRSSEGTSESMMVDPNGAAIYANDQDIFNSAPMMRIDPRERAEGQYSYPVLPCLSVAMPVLEKALSLSV